MINKTPLRYPGGKSVTTPLFIDLIKVNELKGVSYAEPYAGGAGTAINLLLGGYVDRIFINDASIGIYSFWRYVLEESDSFIKTILETPVDLEHWRYFHEFVKTAKCPSFELGFATFFLSRTSRSGILTAGPIGGTTEEKQNRAKYRIDCRYNKTDLISRIQKISKHRGNIVVSNKDAIDFLITLPEDGMNLVYLDPPYFNQGKYLYLNYYSSDDHKFLSEYLSQTTNFRWVLSYDNVAEIRDFYKCFDLYEFQLNYTAQRIKYGSELLTHSPDLKMPNELLIRRRRNNIVLRKIDVYGNYTED